MSKQQIQNGLNLIILYVILKKGKPEKRLTPNIKTSTFCKVSRQLFVVVGGYFLPLKI